MNVVKWFKGEYVSLSKYEYLKNKYEDLVLEFRRYREKTEIKNRNNERLIKELRLQVHANTEMWIIALPYIVSGTPMKQNDKVKIENLAREADVMNPL